VSPNRTQMLLVLCWMLCPSHLALGALVLYDFTNQPGNQAFSAPSNSNMHVQGWNLARGAGLGTPSAIHSFNTSGWHDLASSDYVSFGLDVADGYKASLTEIRFTSQSSASGPGVLGLRSSRDNFVQTLHSWNQTTATPHNVTVDLTMFSDVMGAMEFRIYSLGSTSAGGGAVGNAGTWRIGTTTTPGTSTLLTIQGSVNSIASVPEPWSSWLVLVGLPMALRKRRKSKLVRARPTLGHQQLL
jgi:hypothetical protein